jgi:hypothetical protein
MPRGIATVEKASICGTAVPIRDIWYEFLENGFGIRDTKNSCWPEALYRGNFCTFNDLKGTNKKLRFICDLASDVGKPVLALGYDENGNWIRTLQSGVIADGEVVLLAQAPGTNSTHFFTTLTDLQFNTARDGQVWLYEYNTSDTTQRLIGQYGYDETRPTYARYFFPSIREKTNTAGGCNQTLVNIIAKLDFIPVKADTDYVGIGNIPALKEMMRAIYLAENEPDGSKANDILAKGELLALRELNFELDHFLGDGRTTGVDIMGSNIGTVEPIPAFL